MSLAMQIPKWILHPSLLVAFALVMGYFVWLDFPTVQSSEEPTPVTATTEQEKNLYQITELLPGGKIILDGLENSILINHAKFKSLNEQKAVELSAVFVGRFLVVADKTATQIELPLELYDPHCFRKPLPENTEGIHCPLVINP